MSQLTAAEQQYEGKTLTERWTLAREVTPAHSPEERSAAIAELQVLIEETAGHGGSHRIARVAHKHIAALRLHDPEVPAWLYR